MKLGSWSSIKRSHTKIPPYDFAPLEKAQSKVLRQPVPITSIAVMHYAKRSHPHAHDITFSPFRTDKSTSTHLSTHVYDSRKENCGDSLKYDWKILTLTEIKQAKAENSSQHRAIKGNRKIFVSISKSNKGSLSKEKNRGEPKLAEMGGNLAMLRSISNKRRILDKVELQMEENFRTNRFFCN